MPGRRSRAPIARHAGGESACGSGWPPRPPIICAEIASGCVETAETVPVHVDQAVELDPGGVRRRTFRCCLSPRRRRRGCTVSRPEPIAFPARPPESPPDPAADAAAAADPEGFNNPNHAARRYSWIRPPSTSLRSTRVGVAPGTWAGRMPAGTAGPRPDAVSRRGSARRTPREAVDVQTRQIGRDGRPAPPPSRLAAKTL